MTTTYAEAMQALGGETLVVLFQLDLTNLGDPTTLCFTTDKKNAAGNDNVSFMGTVYTGVDIEATGFEWTGTGPIPQPTIRVSNVGSILSGLLDQYDDLVGAKLTRIRTFSRYLDGAEDASLAATSYQWEVFSVEQKITHNKLYIERRLSAAIDQEGRMLPRRLALRDTCGWRYRTWQPDSGSFDYSNVSCPYVGTAYFNGDGDPVGDPAQDTPSFRSETCCKPRFGANAVLPFGGYPGLMRTR